MLDWIIVDAGWIGKIVEEEIAKLERNLGGERYWKKVSSGML